MRDEDGFFHVVDRMKELINRGGHKVYPREVEEVLHEHPDVVEAAVIGLPHPALGEEVRAVVTLRPHASTTGGELRDFVRAAWPPTSTPGPSTSSTRSPRPRPARSSNARSDWRPEHEHPRDIWPHPSSRSRTSP